MALVIVYIMTWDMDKKSLSSHNITVANSCISQMTIALICGHDFINLLWHLVAFSIGIVKNAAHLHLN